MSAAPIELRMTAGGAALVAAWDDGSSSRFTAAALRLACRCGDCTAARAAGTASAADDKIAIVAVQAVGGYAINIAFSDGHARGIYPWELLKTLDSA